MKRIFTRYLPVLLIGIFLLSACGTPAARLDGAKDQPAVSAANTVSYTLKSGLADGKMVYTGVGGDIDGQTNPNLSANAGDTVKITLISGEGSQHDISFPDFNATSEMVVGKNNQVELTFTANGKGAGSYPYFCTVPGHRQAGMEGQLIVADAGSTQSGQDAQTAAAVPDAPIAADIARDPSDIPGPIGNRGPETVNITLETKEVVGRLADGTSYDYWTFDGKVPGPFLRVRVGDDVNLTLKNAPNSMMGHSIDLHAVTGPGGGAAVTKSAPGELTRLHFKALKTGLYVYHCATPMVAQHISNGMYGMILVEPEGGLQPVDHEFYVMQGEIYTAQPFGQKGPATFDETKLLNETPEYFVFNGEVGALTTLHPLQAKVGETIRIFFGVGGPNFTSSFHVIGEMMDRLYQYGSLASPPLEDVQTTLVPTGGSAIVEMKLEYPGKYILVDHSLSRMERGLAGYLNVDGQKDSTIYGGSIVPSN